jgi:hypothetical protein
MINNSDHTSSESDHAQIPLGRVNATGLIMIERAAKSGANLDRQLQHDLVSSSDYTRGPIATSGLAAGQVGDSDLGGPARGDAPLRLRGGWRCSSTAPRAPHAAFSLCPPPPSLPARAACCLLGPRTRPLFKVHWHSHLVSGRKIRVRAHCQSAFSP